MPRILWASLISLVACTKKESGDSAPPLTVTHETGSNCVGGTPPVISEVTLENSGIARYENDDWPTLTIWVSVSDEDWDINSYKLDLSFDDTVDGTVVPTSDNSFESLGTLADEACGASQGKVGLQVFLTGGGLAYNTLYEWGAVVTDANGFSSDMFTASGYTPTESGADGGP